MPTIQINGADIFYETYGTLRPGQVPVLLIHGSTNIGRTTWRTVVRRLEGRHFIILPDCRGHGQSSNPNLTYSFREHAADMAALVRALGFETVHVVGHSNGGNIALLMLMEQADVTQTCVIQAGNAWVSPDLVAKEPGLFDPAFIERERPAWLRDMRELHSTVHGPDYWRDLVRLTVAEIIQEFQLDPLRDYLERNRRLQDALREGSTIPELKPPYGERVHKPTAATEKPSSGFIYAIG